MWWDVLQAIREAGIGASTTVIVTADHGFVKVEKQIRPNAALRRTVLTRRSRPGRARRRGGREAP